MPATPKSTSPRRAGKPHPQGAGLRFRMVVIGGSAGALEGVLSILGGLPEHFTTPIVVVLHQHPAFRSHAAEIFGRATGLKVKDGVDGEHILDGTVYIASPNRHILVRHGRIELTDTPTIHFSRPSIDATFESVAESYGRRGVGVILSGSGPDGAVGLQAIKAAGGFTVVEDPESAKFRRMPDAAIAGGKVDRIERLESISRLLVDLSRMRLRAPANS